MGSFTSLGLLDGEIAPASCNLSCGSAHFCLVRAVFHLLAKCLPALITCLLSPLRNFGQKQLNALDATESMAYLAYANCAWFFICWCCNFGTHMLCASGLLRTSLAWLARWFVNLGLPCSNGDIPLEEGTCLTFFRLMHVRILSGLYRRTYWKCLVGRSLETSASLPS